MESKTVEEKKTVTSEIAKAPDEVGHAVVDGVETVGQEVAKLVVAGVTIVVNATKTAVSDIAKAGEELGQDAKKAVSVTPEPPQGPPVVVTPPVEVAPAA